MTHRTNPRFPHHCRIVRYATTAPMEDQANVYDPMSDDPLGDEFTEGTNNADQEESINTASLIKPTRFKPLKIAL